MCTLRSRKREVDLGVVEVTDQRREGEEEQRDRDEDLRDRLTQTVAIASFTRGAPVTPLSSPTPEERTTNAVKVQMIIVSMKTESI